jgi:squalene-hopene/tetraprenyl-beta-curcumene cyclase
LCILIVVVMSLGAAAAAQAAGPSGPALGADPKPLQQAVDRAVRFLQTAQAPDGSFSNYAGPGVTALVITALLRNGRGVSDPMVARGLKYMEGMIRPDGGVYQAGAVYSNYETCLAILCFKEANRDGRYDKVLKAADAFVKGKQWDEGEGIDRSNPSYGGAGYGKKERPDLSNTQFLVEALRAAGNGPDDENVQKALVFVSRCQNYYSQHNTTSFALKGPQDGGFYYTVAAGGESMAGKTPEGGLRSYGSMTYAGLKSMIHCGVGPDDPRVKAAIGWIRNNYDVKSNPFMGNAGLYYYYHTFAKALDATKLNLVEDARGLKHNWRIELATELLRRQRPDGSWINENNRWLEGDPCLVTAYALLTLAYCRP